MNGFKRYGQAYKDPALAKQLYIEGRQVKAMIKENANIQWPKRRWGISNKGTRSWFAEHVFVAENRIPLSVIEPSGVDQSFVQTWRGSSIKYEEYVNDAEVAFTIVSDTDIGWDDWATLFVSAEKNGLGASRSTGVGTFTVVRFDKR